MKCLFPGFAHPDSHSSGVLDPDPGDEIKIEFNFVIKDTKCKDQSIYIFLQVCGIPKILDSICNPAFFAVICLCNYFSFRILNYLSFIAPEILKDLPSSCEILSSFTENLKIGSKVQSFNPTLHCMEKRNFMCDDVF
jgi:hypothetical protein